MGSVPPVSLPHTSPHTPNTHPTTTPTQQEAHAPLVYAGHLLEAHGPVRDPANKWHLPAGLYAPSRFPPYAEGPLYVLSQVREIVVCMHVCMCV